MTIAHINRIGAAVPSHDVHAAFVRFVEGSLTKPKEQRLFRRMADRAGIEHRFSFIDAVIRDDGQVVDASGFYQVDAPPQTAARMARFENSAPGLAMKALDALGLDGERERITHLVVAS
ncbi:MAG: hypothetical protein ABI655_08490, partial [Phenylobacterium sp.]